MNQARKRLAKFLGVLMILLVTATAATAALDEPYRTTDGIGVYVGVVPAAITRAHPSPHHERKMHGGAPAGRDEYHLIVALFDQASGARIEDATVEARVSGTGLAGARRTLEPMSIEGTVTYGGYFEMTGPDRYSIRLWIRRAGSTEPAQTEFFYDTRNR